jgi:hypothetical protein
MTTLPREMLRGLAGGAGFLAAWLALAMPWWLAALLGVGLYMGMAFLLSVPPVPRADVSVAPGVTAQEFDEFVRNCSAGAAALEQLAGQLAEGEFRSCVERLAGIAAQLTTYCQRRPESLIAAMSLPRNLDHLLRMLRQYAELSRFPAPSETVAEALQKVEQTVGNAALALEGMYEQLLDNDVAALQSSASSLDYLLGADAGLDRARRKRQTGKLPNLNQPATVPAPPRPWQPEKPQ